MRIGERDERDEGERRHDAQRRDRRDAPWTSPDRSSGSARNMNAVTTYSIAISTAQSGASAHTNAPNDTPLVCQRNRF